MKIFAVNGSPNMKKGMTHILLEDFLEGAREAGAEVETVFLQKKKINYCLGCFDCWVKTPGVCVHKKDDMPELMEKAHQADCMVIGTPLYVDGMTAQTKTFLDRMIPLVDPHFELVDGHYRHPPRDGRSPADVVLVSVCGFYERDNFDGLIDHVTRMCRNMQSRFVGAVVRPSSYIFTLEKILGEQIKEIKEVQIIHKRISDIRIDAIHKATSYLAKTKSVIVLEDLNVSGMMKNHHLAKAIADVGLYKFREQIEYKCWLYGSEVVFADRFFPSSKMCSQCGHIKTDLTLSQRMFICDECGFTLDRDYNASLNLRRVAASSTDTLKMPVGVDGSGLFNIRSSETILNESGNKHYFGTGVLNG